MPTVRATTFKSGARIHGPAVPANMAYHNYIYMAYHTRSEAKTMTKTLCETCGYDWNECGCRTRQAASARTPIAIVNVPGSIVVGGDVITGGRLTRYLRRLREAEQRRMA